MGYLSLVSALSRRTSYTRVGMLDLDRVEMILPQVHLRNGECCGLLAMQLQVLLLFAPPLGSPAAHFRDCLPQPVALLSQGSD